MEIFNLFPTLIVLEKNIITRQQCESIAEYFEHRNYLFCEHNSLIGDSVSTHIFTDSYNREIGSNFYALDEIISNLDGLSQLKNTINLICKEYSDKSGFNFSKITSSWINIQNKGSILESHTHPCSTISGALYINVDDNSSKIYFDNPNCFLDFTNIKKDTTYSYKKYWISPKIGDLILFPSWIKHGSNSEINFTEKRMVLSFNTL